MMLKIQRCIIEINYKVYLIRKPILEIAIRFHNIILYFWLNKYSFIEQKRLP